MLGYTGLRVRSIHGDLAYSIRRPRCSELTKLYLQYPGLRVNNDPVTAQLAAFTEKKLDQEMKEVISVTNDDINGSFGCGRAECKMCTSPVMRS